MEVTRGSNFKISGLLFLCLGSIHLLSAQVVTQKIPSKTNILFLLDGSGSMLAGWENTNRITVAKKLLSETVDSLKINKQVAIGLRVYGHQRHRKLKDCKDSKLEVPFGTNNHQLIKQKLFNITPKGTTPLAYSLEQAANDFPMSSNDRNILIIITDGIESCDGDPCAVSLALQKKRVFLKPFVIGLGMKAEIGSYFDCLGSFYDANGIMDFRKVLNKALKQTLDETTVSVELLDSQNRKTVSNVNITFQNRVTKLPEYEFVHYRDHLGRPDSVTIDGVIPYNLIVNTLPPVSKKNIMVRPGIHNVYKVNAETTALSFEMENATEYKDGLVAIIKNKKFKNWQHFQLFKDRQDYLLGNYTIEINTLPTTRRKVTLHSKQPKKIVIPGPGLANIRSSSSGYGSLYIVEKNGEEHWVKDLTLKQTISTLALQPGKYNLVFRAKKSKGSKYTSIKKFNIKTGETLNLNVF